MMKLMRYVALPVALALLAGCNKSYPEETVEADASTEIRTKKHIEILVNQTGMYDIYFNDGKVAKTPAGLMIDGEPFDIWSTGLFEHDAYAPVYGVEIYEEPEFGTCSLFEKWTDRNSKMVTCVPNGQPTHEVKPWNQDATVDIGRGWSWSIRNDMRVMYSAENTFDLNATKNKDTQHNFVHASFPEILAGTFFDSASGDGNYYKYILPGSAISDNSKLQMDTAMLGLIGSSGEVLSIKRVYTHETDFYYETEYTVEIAHYMSAAEAIAELAQLVHGAVMEAEGTPGHPLVYVPATVEGMMKTTKFRVGTIVGPFGSNSVYGVQVAPESVMGESHFPTVLGASN